MAKNEVYSWRISSDRKSALEEAARGEGTSVGALLDRITDEWLEQRTAHVGSDDAEQARLREAVMRYVGTIRGGDPHASQQVKARVRARLAQKYDRGRL